MKTMLKKLLTACMSVIMVLSCGLMGAAVPPAASVPDVNAALMSPVGFDTLNFSQEEYLQARQDMLRSSDEVQIENVCKAYLATSRARVRMPEAYSSEPFINTSGRASAEIQYRASEYDYLAELYETLGWEVTSDNLHFDSFSVDLTGSTGVATVVESYTYYITDGFGGESFRRREYTINLTNDQNGWSIVGVTTNDPWEQSPSFSYDAIDVDSEVAAQLKQMEEPITLEHLSDSSAKEEAPNPKVMMYKWSYNTTKAVNYAASHYKDTSNSTFGFTAGNNCQNFSSQCVWAGFGGTGTSSSLPAVSTGRVGSSAFNVWCREQSTTYYSNYLFNWPWDNVCSFAKMMRNSTSGVEGPYGNASYINGIQQAEVGNVLSVDWGGSPTETTMDHAMFVTQVSGTSGARTKADVKIAAHTSQTNSAYEAISSYTAQSIGSFGRSWITCGYYLEPQP